MFIPRYILTVFVIVLFSEIVSGQDSLNFPPPSIHPKIYAIEAKDNIVVDGKLNELSWQLAPTISNFFQIQPRQGEKHNFETFVKIVYDKKNIYFGVFCKDTAGKRGVRVQDYRRDFTSANNDVFMIQLDPQNLKRFCASFQTTPLGTQGDMQVFDDVFVDTYWDALWSVKTAVTDSGYYAEFAIPFKSLRYAKTTKDSTAWNITFSRIARRENEQTVFPAIPQIYDQYRMSYGAELKGLTLPPPSVNIRVQPYTLYQYSQNTDINNFSNKNSSFKYGGDIKWAVNTHSVLDLTFNPDFAQANVDQAVNNLTRFNILFPETRQFFLEDQGIFAGASISGLQPFFSRSIGLSNTGFDASPVPIDAGIRFTDRTKDRTFATLFVHQEGTSGQNAADFGVFRYLKNYGQENNIGVMFTDKIDEADPEKKLAGNNNGTLTFDGLIRPNSKISLQYLASVSNDARPDSTGLSGYLNFTYNSNKFYYSYRSEFISEKYDPAMGYIFQSNVFYNQSIEFLNIRPKKERWKWINEWEPGFDINYYQNASNLQFQQANIYFYPLYINLTNGGLIQYAVRPYWQNINFKFDLLSIPIQQKRYFYTLQEISYQSDPSKRLSFTSDLTFGSYYDGSMRSAALGCRFAPDPKVSLLINYTYDQFYHLGLNSTNLTTNLYSGELRLAWNPQILFYAFYQYNSFGRQGQWNAKASWEFTPLSFLYFVYNDNNFGGTPVNNKSLINKITLLKQF